MLTFLGAMIHIVVSGIRNVDEILEKVEFGTSIELNDVVLTLGTLMFFAALFILMKCLEELGLIEFIGIQTTALISQVHCHQS